MPSNQEVMEAKDNHIKDVTTVCRRIMDMRRLSIKVGLFEKGSPLIGPRRRHDCRCTKCLVVHVEEKPWD